MKVLVPEHLVMKDTKGKQRAKSGLKRKRGPEGSYRDAFAAGVSTQRRRAVHWEDHGWNNNTTASMMQNNGRPVNSSGPGSRTPSVMGSLIPQALV